MRYMVYKSKSGKQITFDDYEDNTKEYGCYWVEICSRCYKMNKSEGR